MDSVLKSMHVMYVSNCVLCYMYIYTLGAHLRHDLCSFLALTSLTSWLCMYLIYKTFILLSSCESTLLLMKSLHAFNGLLLVTIWMLLLHTLRTHFFTKQHLNYIYHGSAYDWWTYTTTLMQHSQWVWYRPISLTLTFWLSNVRTAPHIYSRYYNPDRATFHFYVEFFLGDGLHTSGPSLWPQFSYLGSFKHHMTFYYNHFTALHIVTGNHYHNVSIILSFYIFHFA